MGSLINVMLEGNKQQREHNERMAESQKERDKKKQKTEAEQADAAVFEQTKELPLNLVCAHELGSLKRDRSRVSRRRTNQGPTNGECRRHAIEVVSSRGGESNRLLRSKPPGGLDISENQRARNLVFYLERPAA